MNFKHQAKASHAAKRASMGIESAFPVISTPSPSDGPLGNEEQRGLIPLNRKRGGRVVGAVGGKKAAKRLDRPGFGMSPEVPKLDTERGALKKGGRVKRADGGPTRTAAEAAKEFDDSVEGDNGYRHGGRTKRAMGGRISGAPGKSKKGATTVNVVIAGQGSGQQQQPLPIPVPTGGPPAAPQPSPAQMPPPNVMPGGGPAMMPPGGGPMPSMPMRARGGRVNASYDAGSGGGEGRMEKIKKYGANAGKIPPGPNK